MTTAFVPAPWTWPRGVWSVLTVAPSEEPLTLVEAKLRAGLDWPDGDPRDALMQDFIRAARSQVEHDTGLALLTQTHEVTFGDWDACNVITSLVPLPPQTLPAQAVSPPPESLVHVASAVSSAIVRPYRLGEIVRMPWPGPGTWTIVSGWPSAQALRTEAPSLFHAVALLTAHYATLGRDLAALDEATLTPMGYEQAISPHRLIYLGAA